MESSDISQSLIAKQRLDTKIEVYSEEAKNFNQLQEHVKEQSVLVAEKIAFYSAGIASLAVTFLGSLMSSDSGKELLAAKLFSKPILTYFYIAIWLFGITILTGILSRRLDAFYSYYVGAKEFFKKWRDKDAAYLELLQSGYPVVHPVGDNQEKAVERTEAYVAKLEERISEQGRQEGRFFKFKQFSLNSTTITFVVGVFLLLVFATGTIYEYSKLP